VIIVTSCHGRHCLDHNLQKVTDDVFEISHISLVCELVKSGPALYATTKIIQML